MKSFELLYCIISVASMFIHAYSFPCDEKNENATIFRRYFKGMDAIYSNIPSFTDSTCLPVHKQCGWPSHYSEDEKKLPLLVFSLGLEGAGHHLWTEILQKPVFDCVWINGRHYLRDIADGVPRTSLKKHMDGFREHQQLRKESGQQPCKSIYDAEDSFPTGAIRKNGRVFMRPDLVNLQSMDGVLFRLKYLIITRNITDTALSALRRNFYSHVSQEIVTVEHTLTYVEAALRGISCHKIFIAHYEHALADPRAFIEPLSQFLELSPQGKEQLKQRLTKSGKLPSRKAHKLDQYDECKSAGLTGLDCYNKIHDQLNEFFLKRKFMWPTFAANGFDVEPELSQS